MVQKIQSKVHLVSCTNTHHDVTDFVNLGIVKNTKICISWERNKTFLRNNKILNLCLGWYILRGCFIAEVTFKEDGINRSVLVYLFVIFSPLKLLFRRNNKVWPKGHVCKGSSVMSYQTWWYNKLILGKGYSVPRDFSWIKNYKLIQQHHKIFKYLILQNTCVHRRSSYL